MNAGSTTQSPIDDAGRALLVHSFAVADIVRLYAEQTGIDVGRFFDGLTEIGLYECAATGYRFYHPFQVQGDAGFYESLYRGNLQEGREYDRDWSQDHQFGLQQISANDEVLEVGCGSGKFLERARPAARSVCGLEMDPFAAGIAAEKALDVVIGALEQYSQSNENRYDVVCAFQVLEHETDVKGFLNAVIRMLRPNGRLIVSVPNSDPFYQRFNKYEVMNMPPHHVGLWRLSAFERLGDIFDLELTSHRHFEHSRLMVDAYLRAKLWARVRSHPRRHSLSDKAKMLLLAPAAVLRSGIDYSFGKINEAYLVAAFRKTN